MSQKDESELMFSVLRECWWNNHNDWVTSFRSSRVTLLFSPSLTSHRTSVLPEDCCWATASNYLRFIWDSIPRWLRRCKSPLHRHPTIYRHLRRPFKNGWTFLQTTRLHRRISKWRHWSSASIQKHTWMNFGPIRHVRMDGYSPKADPRKLFLAC